jgi:protein-S-isoprenylcysteine O-methyltransferase Ste14
MRNLFFALYGLAAYAFFLATFLYAVAFVGNCPQVPGIDTAGAGTPAVVAMVINLALLALFAVQHSVMARPAFKRAWTRVVPEAIERSTFVLAASGVLALLLWQWRAIGAPVMWDVTGTGLAPVLTAVSLLGWCVVLVSTFLINHFELFGLRQSLAPVLRLPAPVAEFRTPLLYQHVRHPIYLGFIIAFWATPVMTAGHLLFAAMSTGYILVGIFFEERDLVAQFGAQYQAYRARTGMLLPRFGAAKRPPQPELKH